MDHMEAFERLAHLKDPRVLAIGLLVGLSSCTVVTDRMRFHFDDERRGSFSLAAHADAGKPDKDQDDKDPFHTRKDPLEQAIEDKMKACGLSGLVFRGPNDNEYINARGSFNYPDELEMSLACIPSGWDVVRVQSKRDEGLLRYTYVTTIRFEQPQAEVDFAGPDTNVSLNSTDTFPRELSLTVPGTISDVHSDTDILGADFKTEEYGTQEVRAMLTERANADASKDAFVAKVKKEIAAGRISALDVSKLPRNVYAVTVTSYQWRVKFQDILSIAGVLFGSGFLLQFIGSRLPAGKRRRQAAKRAKPSS
jgi:hypothetical protein